MASADLRDELDCSICLTTYTDPVTLRCGHNFCGVCIDRVLDTQDEAGVYSCPECREQFFYRPALKKNITLCKVVENFLSTQSHQEEITGICCTNCIHSPVLAVKSCLHCEVSLCDKHLRVHSKGPEHVLIDPSTNLENRKCSVHKELLKYYCIEDAACICVSCSLAGEHWGHKVEMLDKASEKKKEKLTSILQKLMTKKRETKKRVQSLEKLRKKAQEKASGEAKRVTALFIDIRRRLDNLEKRVQSEISRQEKKVSLSLSNVIKELNTKKCRMSRKMKHIEELCNMTDPLTVLQDPDTGDLCDPEEGRGDEDTKEHDEGDEDTKGDDGGDEDTKGDDGGDEDTGRHDKTQDIDVDVIAGMLHAGLSDIITHLQTISPAKQGKKRKCSSNQTQDLPTSGKKKGGDKAIVRNAGVGGKVMVTEGRIYGQGPADILLDINTAANNILISGDLKTATWTNANQNCPETSERFQYHQVMSIERFTSGQNYWNVEISGSELWMVGVCYSSMDRKGHQSYIGYNNKSWSVFGGKLRNTYLMLHDSKAIQLPHLLSSDRVRVSLDYEAGKLSFYELCDSIRHLHTFTATFTEPLHAVFCVSNGSIKILGGAVAGTSGRT